MEPDAGTPLLRRLLAAAGYRLTDGPTGLFAARRTDRRYVLLVAGERSPTELEADFPPDAVHKILVYSDDPGPVARGAAAERGMEIIDPATIGPGLGEMLLLPPALEVPDDETPGAAAPLVAPDVTFPETERTVKPRLSRQDAEALAGVEGFRYTLRLVPYYLAPYRVRTVTPHGGAAPPTEHWVAVNALGGRVEVWEAGEREFITDVEEPHQRLEPMLQEPDCRGRAERALRRRHTGSVDHTEQHDGAIVIERRRVAPGPDDLKIGAAIVVHAPFWYVEGPQGRVVLDAVTGEKMPTAERESDSTG